MRLIATTARSRMGSPSTSKARANFAPPMIERTASSNPRNIETADRP